MSYTCIYHFSDGSNHEHNFGNTKPREIINEVGKLGLQLDMVGSANKKLIIAYTLHFEFPKEQTERIIANLNKKP